MVMGHTLDAVTHTPMEAIRYHSTFGLSTTDGPGVSPEKSQKTQYTKMVLRRIFSFLKVLTECQDKVVWSRPWVREVGTCEGKSSIIGRVVERRKEEKSIERKKRPAFPFFLLSIILFCKNAVKRVLLLSLF